MITVCNLSPHLLNRIGRRITGAPRTALLTSSLFNESMNEHARRQKVTKALPYPPLDIHAQEAAAQPGKGKIYDKKPFKFYCEAGKTYLWCTCGYSHNQPFCDGHHKNPHFKITLKPVPFRCVESGEYWFCQCKQTSQRPYCDGTHREARIQEAIRS